MRSNLSRFHFHTPSTLDEALSIIASEPGTWLPFAGGTDLMVLLEAGQLHHHQFINLSQFSELDGIEVNEGWVTIGALTSYSKIRSHSVIQTEFPNLAHAAQETGAISIQNRGTLGGNIANASPAADSPPALLTYDAEIELLSKSGSRWIPYSSFHTSYKKTILGQNEIISRIKLPRTFGLYRHYYRKVGTRKAQAISKVCLAACVHLDGMFIRDIRLSLGSVAPIPLLCSRTQAVLCGEKLTPALIRAASDEISLEIQPINDIRSTAVYRKKVTANLLHDFLTPLISSEEGHDKYVELD